MIASPGSIVLYTLTQYDADAINRRRKDFNDYRKAGGPDTGHVAHVGNHAYAGDVYPAVVVRVWGNLSNDSVNLSVLLDGNDIFWATSRTQGDDQGQWTAPARA
jgi:hypothetical protein